jgi:uncharacterized protein (TIRG00374 family)
MWIGIVVSVLALFLAARGVSWREVGNELRGASYVWLVPAVAAVVFGQIARALRWRAMFGLGPRPTLPSAFAILSVGYLINTVLPLRLGDFVRAWLVGATTPAGASEGLATIVLERIVDLLTIVGLVALLVPGPTAGLLAQLPGVGPWVGDPRLVQAAVVSFVVAVYLALILLAVLAEPARRFVERALGRVGMAAERARNLSGAVGRFLTSLGALRRPRTALLVAGWSIVVWLIGGLQVWTVMQAFHMDATFLAAMFVLGATALWAILPSSPGYIGVFQFAIRTSLPVVVPAVAVERAFSFATVLQAVTIVTLIVLGIIGLFMLGMSFGDLMRRAGAGQATADL